MSKVSNKWKELDGRRSFRLTSLCLHGLGVFDKGNLSLDFPCLSSKKRDFSWRNSNFPSLFGLSSPDLWNLFDLKVILLNGEIFRLLITLALFCYSRLVSKGNGSVRMNEMEVHSILVNCFLSLLLWNAPKCTEPCANSANVPSLFFRKKISTRRIRKTRQKLNKLLYFSGFFRKGKLEECHKILISLNMVW